MLKSPVEPPRPAPPGLMKPAFLMTLALLAGNLLGFLRDAAIAAYFGTSSESDAYFLAISIPIVLTIWLWNGLTTSFIPLYVTARQEGRAEETTSVILSNATLFLIALTVLGIWAASPLVTLLAPGFDAHRHDLATHLSQVMMAALLFTGLAGLLTGLLNAHESYFIPALKALINNALFIGTMVVLFPSLGIYSLAVGVVVGACGQVLLLGPSLIKLGIMVRWRPEIRSAVFWRLMLLAGPTFVGMAVSQLNLMIARGFASSLSAGGLAAFSLANTLVALPVAIFATAIATVLYPRLSGYEATGDRQGFAMALKEGLRLVSFIALPASVGLLALRMPIIRLLYERGQFDAQATQLTGSILAYLAFGIIALSGLQIVLRAYFAGNDIRWPLLTSLVAMAFNGVLSYLVVDRYGIWGLATSGTLAAFLQLVLLLGGLWRRLDLALMEEGLVYFRLLLATAVMGGTCHFIAQALGHLEGMALALGLGGTILLGAVLYFVLCWVMGIEATRQILAKIPSQRFVSRSHES